MTRAFKSLPAFNKAMKEEGFDLELVKGKGYFWYYSPDLRISEIPSVYVCHFNHATPEFWGRRFDEALQIAKQGLADHEADKTEPKAQSGPIKISARRRIC